MSGERWADERWADERVSHFASHPSHLIPLCGLESAHYWHPVFLLVAQHNSSKLDSVFAPASVRHSLSKLNSAFDFIDFAIARHSSNKFDSALAYSQNSLTRRFTRKLIKHRKSPFCFLLYRLSVLISSSVFVILTLLTLGNSNKFNCCFTPCRST